MNTRFSPSATWALAGGLGILALCQPSLAFSSSDRVTAVAAHTSDDDARSKLPDGTFQPEYFAFGEGGHWTGATSDPSIDNLRFIDVARAIAGPLGDQNYLPSRDPKKTKLLILVYWGRTRSPGSLNDSLEVQTLQTADSKLGASKSAQDQKLASATVIPSATGPTMVCGRIQTVTDNAQVTDRIDAENASTSALAVVAAENSSRDQIDVQNAAMLGFDAALRETEGLRGTPLEHRRDDLVQEIEQQRYFVVLMAYDFQLLWKEKKHKLLWETRYSVPERGRDFDKYLISMSERASYYFGRKSDGVMHLDLPEGHVNVGDIRTLGALP